MPETLTVPQHLLDLDTGSIDTSFPVLKGALYDLVVKSSELGKTGDGGPMWVLKLATTREEKGVKGEPIKAGAVVFHRVSLTPTDKYDGEAIIKNACRFIQACKPPVNMKISEFVASVNKGDSSLIKLFEGRQLTAKIEALPEGFDKKAQRNLPARNEIGQFEKVK